MGRTYENPLEKYWIDNDWHIPNWIICPGYNGGDEMKLKLEQKVYPHLRKNGTVKVYAFYDHDGLFGIPLLKEDDGISVTTEFDFNMPENPTKTAIDFFDALKEKERANMQVKIEQIEEAKQKFLALEAPQ